MRTENDIVAITRQRESITLLGLIFLRKSLLGEEAFADKYNSAADLSSNGDLKLQESMCM